MSSEDQSKSSQGAFALYTAFQFLLIGILSGREVPKTRATLVCQGLTTFTALGLCLLSHLEHSRSVRPSWVLNVYLLLSLAFDSVRARTLWAIPDNRTLAISFVITVALKGFMVGLEATEKRKDLFHRYQFLPPEATCGIYNAWFFLWLNPLFLRGYKSALTVDKLFYDDPALVPDVQKLGLLEKWRKCKHHYTYNLVASTDHHCSKTKAESQQSLSHCDYAPRSDFCIRHLATPLCYWLQLLSAIPHSEVT